MWDIINHPEPKESCSNFGEHGLTWLVIAQTIDHDAPAASAWTRLVFPVQKLLLGGLSWAVLSGLAWCIRARLAPPRQAPASSSSNSRRRPKKAQRQKRALADRRQQQLEGRATLLAALLDPRKYFQTLLLWHCVGRLVARLATLAIALSCGFPQMVRAVAFPALQLQAPQVCLDLFDSLPLQLLVGAPLLWFFWRLRPRWACLSCCLVLLVCGHK